MCVYVCVCIYIYKMDMYLHNLKSIYIYKLHGTYSKMQMTPPLWQKVKRN